MASMDGASFSSYGMSHQKGEFLILGAGEEAEEGQTVHQVSPMNSVPQSQGTPSQFQFKTFILTSKSLPLFFFFKEDNPLE